MVINPINYNNCSGCSVSPITSKTSYFKDYMNRKIKENQTKIKEDKMEEKQKFDNFDNSLKENFNCNHDPNLMNSTLIKSNKRNMVCPNKINYYCTVCHQCFVFEN